MFLSPNTVHHGDAQDLLAQIEPNSVDLSVWSPPYHLGKEYEKHLSYTAWLDLIRKVICLHYTILKPGAFLAINCADILAFPDERMPRLQALTLGRQKISITREQILEAKAQHPDYNRNQLAALLGCSEQTIDRRLNGNNIRGGKYNAQTRVHLVGGLIEQAGLDAGLYLYDRRVWVKDPAWQNSKWHSLSYRSVDEFEYIYIFWKPGITTVNRKRLTSEEWSGWGSRGVWNIRSVRSNHDHEAKFPAELPRRLIKLLTDPGHLVLDCFMGSGTTGVVAVQEGRSYMGIELQAQYVELAKKNIEASQRTASTRQLTLDAEVLKASQSKKKLKQSSMNGVL